MFLKNFVECRWRFLQYESMKYLVTTFAIFLMNFRIRKKSGKLLH